MKRFLSSPKVTRNVPRMEIRAQQQEVSLRELGRWERGNLCLGEQPAVVMGISLRGTANLRAPTYEVQDSGTGLLLPISLTMLLFHWAVS